jgi:methylenetetrahydrofolate--tRNA-(uracil-5-)-methyltransferase
VLRLIPGLEDATFLRLGQIHRNTYIDAPRILGPTLALRLRPDLYFAGQLAGTEGYVENIATGLVGGINAGRRHRNLPEWTPPRETAMGALIRYVTTPQKHFAPMNINFGLLPPIEGSRRSGKTDRQKRIAERALSRLGQCQPA